MELVLKTLFIYFLIIIILRFMGKREIGQLGLFDFVVLLLIADVASVAIDEGSFWMNLLPIITLALIQKILAFLSLKLNFIRKIFDGKESIIIYNGMLNIKEMKRQNYNVNDLITQTRLKNVKSLSQIEHLVLENNGEISVFLYNMNNIDNNIDNSIDNNNIDNNINLVSNKTNNNNNSLTCNNSDSLNYNVNNEDINNISIYPVIISGEYQKESIKLLKLSYDWLNSEITKQGYELKDIFYANYEYGKLFIIKTYNF